MIYVMSDIHGNKRRFESILEQIALQAEDTLYILGDIIDRHPDGIELLQRIMDMPNVQMLLGNHEVMMLNALSAPESNEGQDDRSKEMWLWYDNGGQITHYDFQQLTYAERDRILQYLKELPLNLEIEVEGGSISWSTLRPSPGIGTWTGNTTASVTSLFGTGTCSAQPMRAPPSSWVIPQHAICWMRAQWCCSMISRPTSSTSTAVAAIPIMSATSMASMVDCAA